MSTIAPGRLFNVSDAASFVALSQRNWVIVSEEVFRRLATYQNGTPNTLNGLPTSGTWGAGDFWRDQKGAEFVCTGAGTPGTWRQITPATVTTDPASGGFPVGYLIVNLTDGGLKRHAGSLSWEIQVGASTAAKVGFRRVTPVGHGASADQPVAADLASVMVLANELRVALVEKGLIKGAS